ncbi:MAG: hypothetical protein IJ092_05415, partial [Atopobiaceae bacterium]|nr:hypothetical protein [Atopobiaceae bacterium]
AEAAAAALQAQRLIARHEVTQDELSEGDLGDVVEVESRWVDNERWRGWLAYVVAQNFRCKAYYKKGPHPRLDVFVGHELDARAAELTYTHLSQVALRLCGRVERRYRAMYGTARGVRHAYMSGFVDGIREELERGTQALMLVRQQDVDDYFDELSHNFSTERKRRVIKVPHDHKAIYADGHECGVDAVRKSRVGGQKGLAS